MGETQKQEETVTLLPQYEDINAVNDALFTMSNSSGLSIKYSGKAKYDIPYFVAGNLRPLKLSIVPTSETDVAIVPNPIRSLAFGLQKNISDFDLSAQLSTDMVDASVVTSPSPFVTAKAGFLTNFQMWNAYAFAIFRQPWSNYCVSFSTSELKKPELQSASAVIGSSKYNVGLQYVPGDQASNISVMSFINLEKYKLHFISNLNNYKIRLSNQFKPNLTIGAQVRVNRDPMYGALDISYIYKKDDSQVHTILSSNGTVYSELTRKLNEKCSLKVNCALNHFEADYTFGVDLSIDQ